MTDNLKIYLPSLSNYKCIVVQSADTIRAYEEIPTNNSTINYRDFYVNSNYMYRDNIQNFSQYTTLPICLDNNNLTDSVFYRNDFDKICIIFLIMVIFNFYLPIKIFSKLFKKGSL